VLPPASANEKVNYGTLGAAIILDPFGPSTVNSCVFAKVRHAAELARRHGGWYAELISAKGQETADGSTTAAMVVRYRLDAWKSSLIRACHSCHGRPPCRDAPARHIG
jgi:hypothetical protein